MNLGDTEERENRTVRWIDLSATRNLLETCRKDLLV